VRFVVIQPEEGGALYPFKLNKIQLWFHFKIVVPLWEAGLPIRVIVLKARQMGFSTYIEIFSYWCTIGHQVWNTLVVGEDDAQVKMLFRMMRRADENLDLTKEGRAIFPELVKYRDSEESMEYKMPSATHRGKLYKKIRSRLKRAQNRYKNTRTNRDAVKLDSRIEVRSAEKKGSLGRAGTYQTVHASECARWPKLLQALSALMAAVHNKLHTSVFIETTANGMNEFHSFWQNLHIGRREVPTIWQRVFVPWYWDDRYEYTGTKLPHTFVNDYEESLFDRIKNDKRMYEEIDPDVTEDRIWAKIFWYRQAIFDKCFGDPEMMKQEYPSTDAEAFLFTGTSAYGAVSLSRIERTIRDPKWQGSINLKLEKKDGKEQDEEKEKEKHEGDETYRPKYEVRLEEDSRGNLKIWHDPEKNHSYCIFADVAEGKALEGVDESKSRWDFSCAQVFKVTSWPPAMQQAAVWHGNCDPDEFGDILVAMGRHYNRAFLGWEINGPGRSLGLQILKGHRYGYVYMRPDYDSITKKPTKKPGWRTTSRSKPDMVAISQRFVRQAEVEIYDAGTYAEMRAFARLGENKWGAAAGHDDRAIAFCGMCAIVEERLVMLKRKYDLAVEEARKKEEPTREDIEDELSNYNPVLGGDW